MFAEPSTYLVVLWQFNGGARVTAFPKSWDTPEEAQASVDHWTAGGFFSVDEHREVCAQAAFEDGLDLAVIVRELDSLVVAAAPLLGGFNPALCA